MCVCYVILRSRFLKKGNIERHHKTVHSNFEKSFPLHSAARKEKLKQLTKQLTGQQSIFLKTVDKNRAATEASYRVSQIIAQKKKPYEDGEMIKQAFLEAADSLFANFRNKDEIVSAIKYMQLSANTVMRRVELQWRDKELAEMISVIKAFIKKLEFWEQNLINSDSQHFYILSEKISQNPLEPYDNKYHVEIISTLKSNFKNRFKYFNEMALVAQFVVSPFMEIDIQQFAACVMQNFGEDTAATEMEVIEFQNDLALKWLVLSTECIWPIELYVNMAYEKAQRRLL
ncbi:unnamed protein product [Diabrotica balteata]|uniref:Uncharacterized protein n=1 Tax=Diabrotica balteata TaxID=107213 RepID=A0A9N9T9H9_DIABA|nr:unnamed protein product [Diabrotica balteata]